VKFCYTESTGSLAKVCLAQHEWRDKTFTRLITKEIHMTLIYACIAPHAGDLIPETVEDKNKVIKTRQAMQAMGAKLEVFAPEVIVIINPHGFRVENAMSISIAERATANWSADVKLDFEMDMQLAHSIANKATEMNVPVVRYIYGASGGPDCFIPLDWGAVVPLYFMGHRFERKPKIVHMSPMRTLPYKTHYEFGRALGRVLNETEERIALIASADQGHAHDINGPYGYDPAAAKYDQWMQETIRSNRLDDLLKADPELVEHGKPDSLWPTLVLAGALKENPMQVRVLSYEVNVYFGIMCAEFQ
jgi:aromatic ring-opening dioxygenase LigB subunit